MRRGILGGSPPFYFPLLFYPTPSLSSLFWLIFTDVPRLSLLEVVGGTPGHAVPWVRSLSSEAEVCIGAHLRLSISQPPPSELPEQLQNVTSTPPWLPMGNRPQL